MSRYALEGTLMGVGQLLHLRPPPPPSKDVALGDARPSGILPAHAEADDAQIITALRGRRDDAGDLLVEGCRAHVERVLYRVMGRTDALADLTQDVFIAVLEGIALLRDDAAFRGWLTQVTVFVARGAIRKRRRKWWLVFTDAVPEESSAPESETSDAVRAVYRALDQLDADERIAFALRKIEGMELTEVAAACNVSLATIKRRLVRAEMHFLELARTEEALATWVVGGAT